MGRADRHLTFARRAARSLGSASGFTLVELLVVMLIVGILSAVAIPAFLNQKGKAGDAAAKVQVRSMQTAIESCTADNTQGQPRYAGCDLTRLNQIEPTIPAVGPDVTLLSANRSYQITSAPTPNIGTRFQITKAVDGTISRDCGTGALPTVGSSGHGVAGCPADGNWVQ